MGKRKELTKEEKERIKDKIRKNYYYIIYNKNKYK